ncbi:hypothetical protein JUNP479_1005 [Aeromonas jandaei]|nr:hypothetical protein JUNP479_1005 [Aeromonas jandaei]
MAAKASQGSAKGMIFNWQYAGNMAKFHVNQKDKAGIKWCRISQQSLRATKPCDLAAAPIDNGFGSGMMRSHFDSPQGSTHDHIHPASAVTALWPVAADPLHRGAEYVGAALAGP